MVASAVEYLVSHGKTGAIGRFQSDCEERFVRGDRVVLNSDRGLSFGVVLCEATLQQLHLLEHSSTGQLLRRANSADDIARRLVSQREQSIFDASRAMTMELGLPMEILDAELALDGRRAILQFLQAEDCNVSVLVERLAHQFDTDVWLENLAGPVLDKHQGGCDKPDCGRSNNSHGCDTCSSGGCSSCGEGKVDVRAYFAHLRDQMQEQRRPLL